jgi:hypothetical protein
MKYALIAMLIATHALLAWSQEASGVITAKVVDEQGSVVSDAIVRMGPPPGQKMIHYLVPECKTDASGSCSLGHLPMETYLVTASKPSDGYADPSIDLYGHHNKPTVVNLTPDGPSANVLVSIGPRAARLSLKIVDSVTDAEIGNSMIILRNASNPSEWVSVRKSSQSTFLVPPDTDTLVEVSAEGYKEWRFVEQPDFARTGPMHLRSNERREMTIQMSHE